MEYYKIVNNNLKPNDHNAVLGLVRHGEYKYERYNRILGKWIEDQELIREVFGVGGNWSQYIPITEAEAMQLIEGWKREQK